MKNLQLCYALLFLFFTSCTIEERIQNPDPVSETLVFNKGVGDYPANILNPYDIAGRMHNEIIQGYINEDVEITSLENTIEQVELLTSHYPEFTAIKTAFYEKPSVERMEYLTNSMPGRISEIITLSSLTMKGKISLANYITNLQWHVVNEKDYDTLYKFTIEYEVSVLKDTDFTANDRTILLTTAAVARYGYHLRKKKVKRRDRDWDISVGNFLTATDGVANSVAEAITMSVVAGIMANR